MKLLDHLLQKWRIQKAKDHIKKGSAVLDVGCANGRLHDMAARRLSVYVGIDPLIEESLERSQNIRLIKGLFPGDMIGKESFDAITALAVVEHIPENKFDNFILGCQKWLKRDGTLILTVPEPIVDRIIVTLKSLGLLDGMQDVEHHGFSPRDLQNKLAQFGFELKHHSKFQLGLNNIFVFQKGRPEAELG